MDLYVIFIIIGLVAASILKVSFKLLSDEKNIPSEEEISIYGITKSDFDNLKTYKYDEIPMFRDLPFKDDYYMAFYIASLYGMNKNNSYIINVILLKWLKDDVISAIDNSNIKLIKEPTDELELELYNMMKKCCDDDILNTLAFKKYCKENYKRFSNWLANTLIFKNGEVSNNREYINIEWVKDNHIDGHYSFIATDKLNEDALKLAGLKKFFHCLSSLHEKMPIEVKLWQDYLIYAEIFGLANSVSDAFGSLYDINMGVYTPTLIDKIVDATIIEALKEISLEEAKEKGLKSNGDHSNDWKSLIDSAILYTAGGGGFSSGGGGTSAFGSGSNGGSR